MTIFFAIVVFGAQWLLSRSNLLVAEADGGLREPFQRIGAVNIGRPRGRRRRRTAVRRRRPSILLRRKVGLPPARAEVYRDEREIIARN